MALYKWMRSVISKILQGFSTLSHNYLTVLANSSSDFFLSRLELLGLDSCNISEFPSFLKNQQELEVLSLSMNKISGDLPRWLLNVSTETMLFVNLSWNSLTGFNKSMISLPWVNLKVLDMSFNMLQGSLPLPSNSTLFHSIANNTLRVR